jgi:type I restriction enzyme S subunit
MFLAKSNVGHKTCRPDDVVINTMWAWMGALGTARQTGIVSPAYGVYRPLAGCNILPRYADQLLRTPEYTAEYQRRSTGVNSSRLRLYPEQFLRISVVVPPPSEQAAIVRFLDWANGRLVRAIRAKRKVIALLNEQKQAIIRRAVTHGLDPSVPLKPSGIPWLGDIPDHWNVRKLRSLFQVQGSGTTPSGDRYYGGAISWVMSGDLNDSVVKKTKQTVHGQALTAYSTLKLYPPNSLVVAMYGATIGKTGDLAEAACTNQACCVLAQPKPEVSVPLMQLVLQTAKPHLLREAYGGGQPNINANVVRSLRVPFPPFKEQNLILTHVDKTTSRLAVAVSRLEREIDFLREYRIRLVADVVTGKLDVRVAAAKLPEEPSPDTSEEDADLIIDPEAADEELAV